jgi:hypothetical protein
MPKKLKYIIKTIHLSLCLINYALGHGDVWENGEIGQSFSTSALDGNE